MNPAIHICQTVTKGTVYINLKICIYNSSPTKQRSNSILTSKTSIFYSCSEIFSSNHTFKCPLGHKRRGNFHHVNDLGMQCFLLFPWNLMLSHFAVVNKWAYHIPPNYAPGIRKITLPVYHCKHVRLNQHITDHWFCDR